MAHVWSYVNDVCWQVGLFQRKPGSASEDKSLTNKSFEARLASLLRVKAGFK